LNTDPRPDPANSSAGKTHHTHKNSPIFISADHRFTAETPRALSHRPPPDEVHAKGAKENPKITKKK